MTQERADEKKHLFVFDMGGVYLDKVDFREEWQKEMGVDNEEFLHEYQMYVWPIMDGEITVDVLYRHMERMFGVKIERDPFFRLFHPEVNKDVLSVIDALRKEGHTVVAGTNNCVPHWRYILDKGWDKAFDSTYPSQIIGLSKPAVAFYRYILDKEGFKAEDAVMIDDSEENLRGARKCGMKTFLLSPEYDRKNLKAALEALW